MTLRKMLSMVLIAVGAIMLGGSPGTAGATKAQSAVLPGTGTVKNWRDGPFTAKDTRLLIYNVSRAGHKHEHMNLEKAIISRSGITIKGRSCDRGDVWLNFWQKARDHLVGGKRCGGKKSFERGSGSTGKGYETLMTYISDQLFIGVGIHGQDVGVPLLIRSNGRKALYLFARNSGNRPVHSIRAVRLTGKKATIERY
jgi:hypothetical protein